MKPTESIAREGEREEAERMASELIAAYERDPNPPPYKVVNVEVARAFQASLARERELEESRDRMFAWQKERAEKAEQREAALAERVEALKGALRDFVKHGIRADTQFTAAATTPDALKVYAQATRLLSGAESYVKEKARAALKEAGE